MKRKKGHPFFSRQWAPKIALLGQSHENVSLEDMVKIAQLQIEGTKRVEFEIFQNLIFSFKFQSFKLQA